MTWGDIDFARAYDGGEGTPADYRADPEKRPTRKSIYNQVADGLRVARLGTTGRRYRFCAEWIDNYLASKSTKPQIGARGAA